MLTDTTYKHAWIYSHNTHTHVHILTCTHRGMHKYMKEPDVTHVMWGFQNSSDSQPDPKIPQPL